MTKTLHTEYEELVFPTIKSNQEVTNCDFFIQECSQPITPSFSCPLMFAELRGVVGFKFSFKTKPEITAEELIHGS